MLKTAMLAGLVSVLAANQSSLALAGASDDACKSYESAVKDVLLTGSLVNPFGLHLDQTQSRAVLAAVPEDAGLRNLTSSGEVARLSVIIDLEALGAEALLGFFDADGCLIVSGWTRLDVIHPIVFDALGSIPDYVPLLVAYPDV